MNKLSALLFAGTVLIFTLFACSPAKIDEQKARYILENAVFSPEQAFKKYKNFYMKTERTVDESAAAGRYVNGLNKEAYGASSLFENKVILELYVQDDKFRLSCYVESLTSPLELHLIYDGGTLWSVSNFAAKDSMQMSFNQAKEFIGFPGPDFLNRLRSRYEQSEKKIWYKHAGVKKYNGSVCDVIEMGQEGIEDSKVVFFIDQKTNIAVKTDWPGIFNSTEIVRKIEKMSGEKVPSMVEILYGGYFTEVIKYSVKTDEYIHPDIFNEANILLPLRSMYKEGKFLREKPEQRRARIRNVLDSVRSFNFVLQNMHSDSSNGQNSEAENESIVIPVLEKRLIPDNFKDYIIPMASEEKPKPQPKEHAPAKPHIEKPVKRSVHAAPAAAASSADKNDETDTLEYAPKDAYQAVEAELEDMKVNDPEGYEKMKKILKEMKAKEANVQNMSY